MVFFFKRNSVFIKQHIYQFSSFYCDLGFSREQTHTLSYPEHALTPSPHKCLALPREQSSCPSHLIIGRLQSQVQKAAKQPAAASTPECDIQGQHMPQAWLIRFVQMRCLPSWKENLCFPSEPQSLMLPYLFP